jgi:hypothetical protein
MTDVESLISISDVREIAQQTPNCVEISQKKHANILSFLKATEPDPARIQIYVDTGTVVILRVLNGSVRHIFIPKCKLRKLEMIFKDPQELSLTDMDSQLQLDHTSKAKIPALTDDLLLEIGEAVLAAESEALNSHYKSLKKRVCRREDPQFSWIYQFSQQDVTKQVDTITRSSKLKMDSVNCIATNGTSAIVLHPKGKGWNISGKVPSALWTKLTQTKSKLTYVSLGSEGRYYASFKDNKTDWDGPKSMDLLFLVRPVKCVAFGAGINDILVVYNDGSWKHFGKIPEELENILNKNGRAKNIECITMGSNGEFFVKNKEGSMWWGGLSKKVDRVFDEIIDDADKTLYFVDFGDSSGTFFMICT